MNAVTPLHLSRLWDVKSDPRRDHRTRQSIMALRLAEERLTHYGDIGHAALLRSHIDALKAAARPERPFGKTVEIDMEIGYEGAWSSIKATVDYDIEKDDNGEPRAYIHSVDATFSKRNLTRDLEATVGDFLIGEGV